MSSVKSALPTDRALIVYGVEQGNTDVAVPYVAGFEYKGVYYRTANYTEGALGIKHWPNTLDEQRTFLESKLSLGTVVRIEIQTFGPNDRTPEEWMSLSEQYTVSNLGLTTESILMLIALQDNDFMERMTGTTTKQVNEQLDSSEGDFGLFSPYIILLTE